MYFNVIDNFNHILQNTVKFRWHFLASQHFSMDDIVCRLTFESNLFDLTSETIKPSSHGSFSIHINTDKNDQFCFPDMYSKTWTCGVGWQQKCTKHIVMHILLKNISHKNKYHCLVVNISRLLNLNYVPW